MSKKKVKRSHSKSNNKINSDNTELKSQEYDSMTGKIIFENVAHNKTCSIEHWNGKEFKLLIDCFQKIESLSWSQIKSDSGLNFERNANIAIQLPKNFPLDCKLYSMRVSKKMRIYGYRAREFFCIIWFDKHHAVCPMDKQKRYTS